MTTVLAPLWIEARAAHAAGVAVSRVGMGRRSGARAAALVTAGSLEPVTVIGFCGGLVPGPKPGDVILGQSLIAPDGAVIACADPEPLAHSLRENGLTVHVGPIACSERLVLGARRAELAGTGALAVEMESSWIASALAPRPVRVLRVVLDTGARELLRPWMTLTGARIAYRTLRRASALLESSDLRTPVVIH